MKKRVTQDDTTAAGGDPIPRLYLREVSPPDGDGPYEGIGADLRAARVEMGVDIAAVADNLRIGKDYLGAIEDGRFGDLPGGAYVYGFLRSYAEYLDLDPKAVIANYKAESEVSRGETKLAFPSPMDQGRLPTGRLLASSLVLAGLVYAGWYIVSGEQQKSAQVVSPVPERFAAIIDNAASSGAAGGQQPGTRSTAGLAVPIQGVEIAPAGPPGEALIAAGPLAGPLTQIPAAQAPQATSATDALPPQVASALQEPAENAVSQPVLPLRRPAQQQVAALALEETPASVAPEDTLTAVAPEITPVPPVSNDARAPVRPVEEASAARPAPSDVSGARDTAPAASRGQVSEFAGLGALGATAVVETRKVETPPPVETETRETVAPTVVEAAAPPPRPPRKVAKAPQVVAAELPPVPVSPTPVSPPVANIPTVEPVRSDVQIAAASVTAREIAEEEEVAETLAASPVIEQTPLAAPAPRVVPTEPAFLAAERAQAEERKRRELAAEGERLAAVQATVVARVRAATPNSGTPNSGTIDVAELLPAAATATPNQGANSVQLAAARRISELTNSAATADGAASSFPVPPPIPESPQTAALDNSGDYVPQVFGASNEDSRVTIEAKLESWVQVRGRSGETLLTRILRVGDKYLVPNRDNLVMMTGNAGALTIIVDGKEIGPLGPPGAVLRDVSLEPSQLLARASAQ